jgi:hypothetical protein
VNHTTDADLHLYPDARTIQANRRANSAQALAAAYRQCPERARARFDELAATAGLDTAEQAGGR